MQLRVRISGFFFRKIRSLLKPRMLHSGLLIPITGRTLYEEAILEYQSLIDVYPRDSRVPLAYLKQGLSLMKLNKNEEAKLFLQTLVDKYPNSPEADEARKKISELELNS